MLTGREQETAFLENHYKRPGSQILVVYGQRGVGKTALLTAFAEKKQTIRYTAPNCSSREMCYQWGQELREQGKEISRSLPGKKYYSVYPEKKVIAKKF